MLSLTTVLQKLQVVLTAAKTTTDMPWTVSYDNMSLSTFAVKSANGTTNGVTAQDAVPVPAAGEENVVKHFSLSNVDTASKTAVVRILDNATPRIVVRALLAVGDTLYYEDGRGWYVLDANGAEKTSGSGGGGSVTVTEMDGVPSVSVGTIKLPNGSVTDLGGGVAQVTFSGGGSGDGVAAAYYFSG